MGPLKAGGVEAVAVLGGQGSELVEVLVGDGLLHFLHAEWHRLGDALEEEGARLDGGLHACGATDILLLCACHEDDGAHVWPMGSGGDLDCYTVGTVTLAAYVPRYVTTEERATCRIRSLSCYPAEFGRCRRQFVQVGNGADEGSETGSA